MRLFDIIGALMVAAWVGVVGNILYLEYAAPELDQVSGAAVFREGESYMLLTREDEEVGYLHESRTELAETAGWLLEYDLMLNVSMLGINQYVRTDIKATVDRSAYLREFSAAIETAGTSFEVQGEVVDKTVKMSMDIAGATRTQSIELQDKPRLSNSALNELVANPDLKPGMSFEQEYFDPTTMGMTQMTFEYIRKHQINVYDELVDTFHFRQKVGGTELDAFVDEFGEVQLQEFPLRIVGAKVPLTLGKSRASSIRQKYEEAQKGAGTDGTSSPNLSLEATMDLIRGGDLRGVDTSRYRISQIPPDAELSLDSHEQMATASEDGSFEVDTAKRRDDVPGLEDEAPLLASDLRVDADNEAFDALVTTELPDSATLRAELVARAVRRAMKPVGEIGIQTASAALAKGEGDCTEYALVLVAALRHFEVPARFVTGVKANKDGQFILHQWAQYWDGVRFVDLDATTETMLPNTSQIQLLTHAAPDAPEIVGIIDQLKIEKLIDEAPAAPAEPSDFN